MPLKKFKKEVHDESIYDNTRGGTGLKRSIRL